MCLQVLTSLAMFGRQFTAPALCVMELEHGLPICFDVLPEILLLKSLQQTHSMACFLADRTCTIDINSPF